MLTFRRALALAALLVTLFFLFSPSSHHAKPHRPLNHARAHPNPSPSPTRARVRPPSPSPDPDPGHGSPSPRGSTSPPQSSSSLASPTLARLPSPPTAPLAEQLESLYPYDARATAKFPAYIWQTWKTSPAQPGFIFHNQEASWTDQHPGFLHHVLTDTAAARLVRVLYAGVPDVVTAYAALPLPVLRADFLRYLVLLARGGIYADIDTYAIRSAVDWIPAQVPHADVGLVIGVEADPNRNDWARWYSRRIQFCQWTMMAKPGHPVLRDVVVRITRETLRRMRAGTLGLTRDQNVVEFTGPALWTDVIFDYFNDERYFETEGQPRIEPRNFTSMVTPKKIGDVIVLPITGFSPGVGQMGAKDYDDPMAMIKHDFEGTWKPEIERHIGAIYEDPRQAQPQPPVAAAEGVREDEVVVPDNQQDLQQEQEENSQSGLRRSPVAPPRPPVPLQQ